MIDLTTLPRLQRAGWTALTAVLALLILTGMWATLEPDPGALTAVVETSTENQMGVWTVGLLLMLGGVWTISALLVRNAAATLHAGQRLLWDVPFVVSGLTFGSLLLALAAPFCGFIFQVLSSAVLLSALGKWIDGAVTEHRIRTEAGQR